MCVCVCVCVLSRVGLFGALWIAAPAREFSRQQYWSGLPFPTPGNLPSPGVEPGSLAAPALADGWILYPCAIWEAPIQLERWSLPRFCPNAPSEG